MDGKNILDSSEQSKREQKSARKPKRKRAKPAARNRGQRREAQPSRKLIREAKIHRVYQKGMTKKQLWKAVNQAKQEGRPRMSSPEQIELGEKFDIDVRDMTMEEADVTIKEVIEYRQQLVGLIHDELGSPLADNRGEHWTDCPFCGKAEEERKFSYRIESGGHDEFDNLLYKCLSCQSGGGTKDLAEHLDLAYNGSPAAGHYTPPTSSEGQAAPPWLGMVDELLAEYTSHPDRVQLWRAYKPLSSETINKHKLGYGRLPNGKGGRYNFECLILPVFENGRCVGFRGRGKKGWMNAPGSTAKLFNGDAVTDDCVVVVTENNVDSLLLMQETPQVVAVSSTAGVTTWRDEWSQRLAVATLVVVATDNDHAGQASGEYLEKILAQWAADPKKLGQPPLCGIKKIKPSLEAAGTYVQLYPWAVPGMDVGDYLTGVIAGEWAEQGSAVPQKWLAKVEASRAERAAHHGSSRQVFEDFILSSLLSAPLPADQEPPQSADHSQDDSEKLTQTVRHLPDGTKETWNPINKPVIGKMPVGEGYKGSQPPVVVDRRIHDHRTLGHEGPAKSLVFAEEGSESSNGHKPQEDTPSAAVDKGQDAPANQTHQQEALVGHPDYQNGHSNGHHQNGHSNGHHQNGHSNGHHQNSHSNGHHQNAHSNGHHQNGHQNGHHQNGHLNAHQQHENAHQQHENAHQQHENAHYHNGHSNAHHQDAQASNDDYQNGHYEHQNAHQQHQNGHQQPAHSNAHHQNGHQNGHQQPAHSNGHYQNGHQNAHQQPAHSNAHHQNGHSNAHHHNGHSNGPYQNAAQPAGRSFDELAAQIEQLYLNRTAGAQIIDIAYEWMDEVVGLPKSHVNRLVERLRSAGVSSRAAQNWRASVNAEKKKRAQEMRKVNQREMLNGTRPLIVTRNRSLRDVGEETLEALLKLNEQEPKIFVRNGNLVRVRHNEEGRPSICNLCELSLTAYMAEAADWARPNRNGELVFDFPHHRVAKHVLVRDNWLDFPALKKVVLHPLVGPDGTIEFGPGYLPNSRAYYSPYKAVELGDTTPTAPNIAKAKALIIEDLLGDFPLVDDGSIAQAIALYLQAIVKPYIGSNTPLYMIDAPRPDSGKTLLGQVLLSLADPGGVAIGTAPSTEEEMCKRITSTLMSGRPYLFLDNIKGLLSSPSLEAMLSAQRHDDRLLGTNHIYDGPADLSVVATANNVSLSYDLCHRTVWINLDPGEKSDQRPDFKHAEILQHVEENREQYLTAAITLVRAWVEQGCPFGQAYHSKYPRWAAVMSGILEVAGIPGFLANAEKMRAGGDLQDDAWARFTYQWYLNHGTNPVYARDLMALASYHSQTGEGMNLLAEQLIGPDSERDERGRTCALGGLLKSQAGRTFGGLQIMVAQRDPNSRHKGANRYYLQQMPGFILLTYCRGCGQELLDGLCPDCDGGDDDGGQPDSFDKLRNRNQGPDDSGQYWENDCPESEAALGDDDQQKEEVSASPTNDFSGGQQSFAQTPELKSPPAAAAQMATQVTETPVAEAPQMVTEVTDRLVAEAPQMVTEVTPAPQTPLAGPEATVAAQLMMVTEATEAKEATQSAGITEAINAPPNVASDDMNHARDKLVAPQAQPHPMPLPETPMQEAQIGPASRADEPSDECAYCVEILNSIGLLVDQMINANPKDQKTWHDWYIEAEQAAIDKNLAEMRWRYDQTVALRDKL
ncbi:MAG: hypothetical protein ACPGWR_03220 [Ardenticatenaceae bacterium]